MAYKFIKTAYKDHLKMFKAEVDGQEVWVNCSDAIKNYAKNNINEGDMVDFEYKKEGKNYTVTSDKVIKVGTGGNTASKPITSKPKSSGSYSSSYSGEFMRPKTPEERQDIRQQAIGHMVSRVIAGLEGVDVNNVHEISYEVAQTFTDIANGNINNG